MISKEITYVDPLSEEKVAETFYFHLNKAELTEMQFSKAGGLESYLEEIIDSDDTKAVLEIFKEIVWKSVGRRSEDGKRFIKDDDARSALFDTDAYSELFFELMSNADSAALFINGIIPKEIVEQINNDTHSVKEPDGVSRREQLLKELESLKED